MRYFLSLPLSLLPSFNHPSLPPSPSPQSDSSLSLYHQFYITLMLHSLLRAGSAHAVWVVAEYFHCSRGFLQNIINSTAAFASCLVHFTEVSTLPTRRVCNFILRHCFS